MLIPFDELFRRHNIKSTGVLHLGANTGQEAEAYYKQGITEVIWVEALTELALLCNSYVKDFVQMKSTVLNACVSDTTGKEVTFNVANNEGQSSSFLQFGTHRQEHPTVKFVQNVPMTTFRVDDLLAMNELTVGPGWFLNIDLQGAELLALKGMGNLLVEFDHIYVEVNRAELYRGCPMIEEIDRFLEGFDFLRKEVKWTGSGWGDAFFTHTKK